MAHKVGQAKPPIETKTAVKGILVGLAMMVLAIAVPLALSQLLGCGSGSSISNGNGNTQPLAAIDSHGLPVSAAPVLYFEQGQRSVTVQLRADMWSREIETPSDSQDYRITVEPRFGCFVLFKDGTVAELRTDQLEVSDFGVRRGIFRLLGNSNGQTATVTISY